MHSWERFKRSIRDSEEKLEVKVYRMDQYPHHAARPAPRRRTGKNKKNAFFMYMEARKSEMQASGRKFTRGFAEVADVVSSDWEKLTPAEKAVYEEKARIYNGTGPSEKEQDSNQKLMRVLPNEEPEEYYVRIEMAAWKAKLEENRKLNRAIVWEMFEKEDWPKQHIVVCNVTLHFEPDVRIAPQEFIPAEIGLTAFSLTDGIVGNFARLIDPGDDIPIAYGGDAFCNVEKMGLPSLGSCAELQRYDVLLTQMERFLAEYAGNSNDGFYVFALNSELEMVTRSLNWICEVAGRSIRYKVLSLSLWAHLASTNADHSKDFRQPSYEDNLDHISSRRWFHHLDSRKMHGFVALNRELQQRFFRHYKPALTRSFYYPDDHPLLKNGVFLEASIDSILQRTLNYAYYEQLSCMYHMKKYQKTDCCALHVSNRYVFYIIEILTISNYVKNIRCGFHYPAAEKSDIFEERDRRLAMLRRWGVTAMELQLKWETPEQLIARENEEYKRFKDGLLRRNPREVKESAANVPRRNFRQNAGRNGAQLGGQRAYYDAGVGNLPGTFREMALDKK